MVWERSNQHGGFSTAARTWLPVPAAHLGHAVAAQGALGLMTFYRAAIALRAAHPALIGGAMSAVDVTGGAVSFTRSDGGETLFCAFNLEDAPVTLALPEGDWQAMGPEIGGSTPGAEGVLQLDGWGFALLRREQRQ